MNQFSMSVNRACQNGMNILKELNGSAIEAVAEAIKQLEV